MRNFINSIANLRFIVTIILHTIQCKHIKRVPRKKKNVHVNYITMIYHFHRLQFRKGDSSRKIVSFYNL